VLDKAKPITIEPRRFRIMESTLRRLRTPETVVTRERNHSSAMDRNYRNDPSRATTESAKNKGVHRLKKFVAHVDSDRLDRDSRERFG